MSPPWTAPLPFCDAWDQGLFESGVLALFLVDPDGELREASNRPAAQTQRRWRSSARAIARLWPSSVLITTVVAPMQRTVSTRSDGIPNNQKKSKISVCLIPMCLQTNDCSSCCDRIIFFIDDGLHLSRCALCPSPPFERRHGPPLRTQDSSRSTA